MGLFNKLKNSGITLPVLTDPLSIFKLISGDFSDITFFDWDMPVLDLGFDMRQSYPVFPGLNAFFGGGFDILVDMRFGYDSTGIEQFIQSGNTDVAALGEGFFINDLNSKNVDVDELSFVLTIGAGASVGVKGLVEAGVEGGLQGILNLNLHNFNSNPE